MQLATTREQVASLFKKLSLLTHTKADDELAYRPDIDRRIIVAAILGGAVEAEVGGDRGHAGDMLSPLTPCAKFL